LGFAADAAAERGGAGVASEREMRGAVAGAERESCGQSSGGVTLAEPGVGGVGSPDVVTPYLDGTSTSEVPAPPTQAQGPPQDDVGAIARERAGGLDGRSPKSKFPPPKSGVRIGLGAGKRSVNRKL